MSEEREPADVPDDVAHLDQAIDLLRDDPEMAQVTCALNLLGRGLSLLPQLSWSDVFANDLSAAVCLGRAYRQLRAAVTVMMSGYYAETRALLRSVYESAGLARLLAKEPAMAEQWLRKGQWFPEKEVRRWLKNVRGDSDENVTHYRQHYVQMSAWPHPTFVSCFELIEPDDGHFMLRLNTRFDEQGLRSCMKEIALTAIFACFALRNAAVKEGVIPASWRTDLYELASKVLAHDPPHLDRNWEQEQDNYNIFQRRVQAASRLDERLDQHPASWRNTNPQL
ncbi:MAG: hypothetical protein ACRDR6_22360 [Pseudonocardiaceae bacterium]